MKNLHNKQPILELTDPSLLELVSGGMSSHSDICNWIEAIIPKKPPTLPLEPAPKN